MFNSNIDYSLSYATDRLRTMMRASARVRIFFIVFSPYEDFLYLLRIPPQYSQRDYRRTSSDLLTFRYSSRESVVTTVRMAANAAAIPSLPRRMAR